MKINKSYPINGLEQDVIYNRKFYKYLANNSKLVKWVKRKMNKRFRQQMKDEVQSN